MRYPLIRSAVLLSSVCALFSACSTAGPGWAWPGERAPAAPMPVAAVVAAPPTSLEDACHAQAWQHRLDVPGDERLSYGQAFRRCMEQQAATTPPAAAAPDDRPIPARGPRPARASRN